MRIVTALTAAALSAFVGLLAACSRHTYSPPASTVLSKMSFGVRRHVLANGLEILLQEDHHAPSVALNLWYHVGSRDDPPGRTGLAHLFEHLTFTRTKHIGADDLKPILRKAGATGVNGETSYDRTQYYETVPSSQLELALWVESDRMGFFVEAIDGAMLARERDVVKNERRERYEDEPYGMVGMIADEALFPPDHPYHHHPIGAANDLDAATLADVQAFFARYYVPDNATLVLVGDFRADEALALVRKYFEPIPRGAAPLPRYPAMPVQLDHERTIGVEARVDLPMLEYRWAAPACCAEAALPTSTALAEGVLFDELVTSDTELVDVAKIATRVRMGYQARELTGVASLDLRLKGGVDPVAARKIVDEAMQRLSARRFYRNAVLRAAFEQSAAYVYDLEDFAGRAETFNTFSRFAGDPLYASKLIDAFEVMDPESVRVAFRDWIVQADGVVVFVTPSKGAPAGGRVAWSR